MLRHIRCAAVIAAAAASLATAGAAHATTIQGSATFADTTNSNDLTVQSAFNGTGHNGDNFSTSATVGGSAVSYNDFLTLYSTIDSNDQQTVTDNISVTFAITQPGTGNGSLGGGVTEDQTVTGRYDHQTISDTGSVTWDNPLTIALSDGDDLVINLSDASLTSSWSCGGSDVCGNVDATFQLTDPTPAPVPEPATLALLGSGLLGLGFVARRKRG